MLLDYFVVLDFELAAPPGWGRFLDWHKCRCGPGPGRGLWWSNRGCQDGLTSPLACRPRYRAVGPIDAMSSARKRASSSGKRRPGGPPTRSGFGATPANPQAELAEAERLAAAHSLLGAQDHLDAIRPILGRTPRFRLIQG